MYIGLQVKYRLLLSDFDSSWIFSTEIFFRKVFEYQNFTKLCPFGAELFYKAWQKDRRTYMKKLIAAFRNFEKNALKIEDNYWLELKWIFLRDSLLNSDEFTLGVTT